MINQQHRYIASTFSVQGTLKSLIIFLIPSLCACSATSHDHLSFQALRTIETDYQALAGVHLRPDEGLWDFGLYGRSEASLFEMPRRIPIGDTFGYYLIDTNLALNNEGGSAVPAVYVNIVGGTIRFGKSRNWVNLDLELDRFDWAQISLHITTRYPNMERLQQNTFQRQVHLTGPQVAGATRPDRALTMALESLFLDYLADIGKTVRSNQ